MRSIYDRELKYSMDNWKQNYMHAFLSGKQTIRYDTLAQKGTGCA